MNLLDEVRRLVNRAVDTYRGTEHEVRLLSVRQRLEEPLRVAIAGKVKAGKSTLLNALVGEELAPTDAGECTRIVTWYRDSHTSQVTLELRDEGTARQVSFTRDAGAIHIDLGSNDPDAIARLVVDWPSQRLRQMTLIDTPGIASLSAEVSERAHAFLTPDDGQEAQADAVVYLMKHFHAADARFLETFHDDEVAQATPVNAIAVLSRADEVGAGRPDAMESAARIAARYRDDPRLRRLCQTVVPVAGLVAQSASTLREREFSALRALAGAEATEVERMLASADRFVHADTATGVSSDTRRDLLVRFGVFGVRLATELLRDGTVTTAQQLSTELVRASGLDDLRTALTELFGERSELLKARSGLLAVEGIIRAAPIEGSEVLDSELERIESSTHDFTESRMLSLLRTGVVTLPGEEGERAIRLLGGEGAGARARLAAAPDASDSDLRVAAIEALAHWRARAENPMLTADAVEACVVLVRTCEGMLTRYS